MGYGHINERANLQCSVQMRFHFLGGDFFLILLGVVIIRLINEKKTIGEKIKYGMTNLDQFFKKNIFIYNCMMRICRIVCVVPFPSKYKAFKKVQRTKTFFIFFCSEIWASSMQRLQKHCRLFKGSEHEKLGLFARPFRI